MASAARDGCGLPQGDRKGDWIQTYMGRQYWPLDPSSADVSIVDIAHHLGNLCRYTGACNRFYSVAEHAWHASFVMPRPGLRLWTLHHDDAEYVCNDIARPVKREIVGYDAIEAANMAAIVDKLALLPLSDVEQSEIKHIDNVMLLAEQRVLMRPAPAKWARLDVSPVLVDQAEARLRSIGPLTAEQAKWAFLERHLELTGA